MRVVVFNTKTYDREYPWLVAMGISRQYKNIVEMDNCSSLLYFCIPNERTIVRSYSPGNSALRLFRNAEVPS